MRTLDIEHLTQQELIERECLAYADGNEELANLYAECARLRVLVDQLEEVETLESWEKRNGSAGEYKDFFEACFHHLNSHYPCPSIDSQHDQSVIFEAIRRGDGTPD